MAPSVPPGRAADQEQAEAAIALSHRAGICALGGGGTISAGLGAGRAGTGQRRASRRCSRAWRPSGPQGQSLRPYYLALLAEAYGKAGQAAEGLTVLAEALAAGGQNRGAPLGGRAVSAQGRATAAASRPRSVRGRNLFAQALGIARRQQAKSLELRAAMSLAGCGSSRASTPKPMSSWHRSMAGSPRALIRPTSRRPRRCWMS